MTLHLSEESLRKAVGRLAVSSAEARLGDYLVFKRALKVRRNTAEDDIEPVPHIVVTGTRSTHFMQAHIDLGLWVPPTRVKTALDCDDLVTGMQTLITGGQDGKARDSALLSPYYVPFGARRDCSLGYRQSKWPSNGPSDTVNRWQSRSTTPLVFVPDTSPKKYSFEARSESQLADFFTSSGASEHFSGERPRLLDTAIWWFRRTDLEERFRSEPTEEDLVVAFIGDLELGESEILGLFHQEQREGPDRQALPDDGPELREEG